MRAITPAGGGRGCLPTPRGGRVCVYTGRLSYSMCGGCVSLHRMHRMHRMDGVAWGAQVVGCRPWSAGVLDFLGWMNSAWGSAISDRECIVMGSGHSGPHWLGGCDVGDDH